MTGQWPLFQEPLSLLDLTLPTPEENLALDEALLRNIEGGEAGPCLRLWETDRPVVVLGRAGAVDDEVHIDACRRDGVPVLRRCSGGGSVLLARGCQNFALVHGLPEDRRLEIKTVTAAIMQRAVDVLQTDAPGLRFHGTSDLALGDLKVSGNSQRWLRRSVLHHGTFLYDFDLELVSRYLAEPPRQPAYRRGRKHLDFLTNLALPRDTLLDRLVLAWNALGPRIGELSEPVRRWMAERSLRNAQSRVNGGNSAGKPASQTLG